MCQNDPILEIFSDDFGLFKSYRKNKKLLSNAPKWCKLVQMANVVKGSKSSVRSSISFPQNIYSSLEEIALEKKVSLAWVVREAVETYLKGQKEGRVNKNV